MIQDVAARYDELGLAVGRLLRSGYGTMPLAEILPRTREIAVSAADGLRVSALRLRTPLFVYTELYATGVFDQEAVVV